MSNQYKLIVRPQNITFNELIGGIRTRAGGVVDISGEGIKSGTQIGLGQAIFLARIPDEGISVEDVLKEKGRLGIRWVEESLTPTGLTEKRNNDFVYLTEAARKATYHLRPNPRLPY